MSRRNPLAVTGSGSIVSYAVKSGDQVQRGDLLFETLDGSFDGFYMSGKEIYAGVSGTLAEIKVSAGSGVQKDSVCAIIYPSDSMRISAEVSQEDLDLLSVGDPVIIELTADEDAGTSYDGTVSMISRIASSSGNTESVTFTVYVDFTADSHVRYGMSAVVSTPEDEQAEASEESVLDIENEEPEALDADASNASSGENRRGGRGDKKDEDHKEGEGAGE